ncbi:hypothetical protein ABIE13_002602 [Ottowia thiooxydans]|uniref:Uncharacterized protein n=1 Tax=Ottowia thiooxydans TaxID=219182 RepID=A0ABV2Q8W4_9BURK
MSGCIQHAANVSQTAAQSNAYKRGGAALRDRSRMHFLSALHLNTVCCIALVHSASFRVRWGSGNYLLAVPTR